MYNSLPYENVFHLTSSFYYLISVLVRNEIVLIFFFFSLNSAVIGEIDEETDSALDLGNIRAEPLNSVAHWGKTTYIGQL